jgi:hypothetical protein
MIARDENGKVEVAVSVGFIDVLTESKIIEVKIVDKWKHAVGQVLVYACDLPNCYEKWVYLYGACTIAGGSANKNLIVEHCSKLDVRVKFILE